MTVVAGLSLFGGGVASAVINPAGVAHGLVAGIVGQHELGIMSVGGQRVVCIDESGGSFGYVSAPSYLPAPALVEDWAAAYALQRWLATGDDREAAALYMILGADLGLNSNPSEVSRAWNGLLTWSSLGGLDGVRASMLAEISANQGPYVNHDLKLRITDGVGRVGVVDGVGLVSTAGVWQSGYPATLTLLNADDPSGSAPAVWDATGTATMSLTTASTAIDGLAWTAVGTGSLTARLDAGGIAQYYLLYPSPQAGQQRTVAAPIPGSVTFFDPDGVGVRNIATLSTSVESALVVPGGVVADSWTAVGGSPDTSQPALAELFGPFDVQPTASTPMGSAAVSVPFTVDWDGDGEASGRVEAVLPASADVGFYTWLLTLAADGSNPESVSDWGVVAETVLVADPRVVTRVSSQEAMPGDVISDSVEVSGLVDVLPDGTPVTVTVSGELVSAPALVGQGGDPTCQGIDWSRGTRVLDIPEVVVTADGVFEGVGVYAVPADSPRVCYSYGETLTLTPEAGSTPALVVEHAAGDVAQTTLIWNPGARIRSGGPGVAGSVGPWGPLAGVGLVGLAGGAVWLVRRRFVRG
ncbi:MAG: hypothetical protein LBJ44_12005 [Propionibacteriaceae bacterium]|nr:hypothetical protein [Propionibacteriaceae bacterium]